MPVRLAALATNAVGVTDERVRIWVRPVPPHDEAPPGDIPQSRSRESLRWTFGDGRVERTDSHWKIVERASGG
jgi:hypothetical protein